MSLPQSLSVSLSASLGYSTVCGSSAIPTVLVESGEDPLREAIAAQKTKYKIPNMKTNTMDQGDVDLSVLRTPIPTSVTGFMGVMKAFGDGTEEVHI